jgi:integrase/recombinase XerD
MAKLRLSDLTADVIADLLDYIEADRSNAAATRNCRRAALRSFITHLLRNDLAHSLQYTQILAIPSKKARQRPATYLEPDGVRAIIGKPDRETPYGWRDYTLLLFLYNCGARVSEATDVRWNDLHLTSPRQVRLRGKGKKERLLPVWRETQSGLRSERRHCSGARAEEIRTGSSFLVRAEHMPPDKFGYDTEDDPEVARTEDDPDGESFADSRE